MVTRLVCSRLVSDPLVLVSRLFLPIVFNASQGCGESFEVHVVGMEEDIMNSFFKKPF